MRQVLHNPRCGKSRSCLAFLNDSHKPYEIISYLENPLSVAEINTLLKKLAMKPINLVRQKEAVWIENYKGKTLSDDAVILALSKHPILIERPIVIDGDKAFIAREAETLTRFI